MREDKTEMKLIANILPHLCIILSGMMIVLLVIDKFNSQMGFIDNDITKNLLIVQMVAVTICSIMLIRRQRRDD